MVDLVWFLDVEVRALAGENQALVEGSTAVLQCFVPAATLEDALPRLDELLAAESFERMGIRVSQSFRPDISRKEIDNPLLSDGVAKAASTRLPVRGVMIVARETSRWKDSAVRK